MVQTGVRKILNDVIDGDSIIEHYNIETVANMYPGAAVKRDSTDFDIEVCGAAGDIIGWLGYGACVGSFKPATRDTIYDVSGNAPVHSGGGFYVRARIVSEAVTKGAELTTDTNGTVTAVTIGTNLVAAKAAETVADTATHIWVLSLI